MLTFQIIDSPHIYNHPMVSKEVCTNRRSNHVIILTLFFFKATIILIDLNQSMSDTHHGRQVSDYDWGMEYPFHRVAEKIMSKRKTDVVSVVICNTDGKSNAIGFCLFTYF